MADLLPRRRPTLQGKTLKQFLIDALAAAAEVETKRKRERERSITANPTPAPQDSDNGCELTTTNEQ